MVQVNATGRKANGSPRTVPGKLRMRVLAAFQEFANGVDERTARARTHAFYRSGGAEWTRHLS